MKTIWTPREIAGSYQRSGEQASQIQIIADCNACDKETIKQILKEQGFKLKERKKRKMARTKKTMPQSVENVLRERLQQITKELEENAEKTEALKIQEDGLTQLYKEISDYLGTAAFSQDGGAQEEGAGD